MSFNGFENQNNHITTEELLGSAGQQMKIKAYGFLASFYCSGTGLQSGLEH